MTFKDMPCFMVAATGDEENADATTSNNALDSNNVADDVDVAEERDGPEEVRYAMIILCYLIVSFTCMYRLSIQRTEL